MAGVKISALPAVSSLTPADLFPVVQAGVTSQATISEIFDAVGSNDSPFLASTGALTATYSNGTAGVGATLTNAGAMAALVLDGTTVTAGMEVLIKNQASSLQNGIYTVTTVGDGVTNWVLTRSIDFDTPAQVNQNRNFTVISGTVNGLQAFINNSVAPITVGTTAITFVQQVAAGAGISIVNNTISSTAMGMTWNSVAGTSATMVAENGYVTQNVGLTTLTLPATAAFGTMITIAGRGTGGWAIAQGVGQFIHVGNVATMAGAGGSLSSTNQFDTIDLVCIDANLEWTTVGSQGNFTIV